MRKAAKSWQVPQTPDKGYNDISPSDNNNSYLSAYTERAAAYWNIASESVSQAAESTVNSISDWLPFYNKPHDALPRTPSDSSADSMMGSSTRKRMGTRMSLFFQNPYHTIRTRPMEQASLATARDLLNAVPVDENESILMTNWGLHRQSVHRLPSVYARKLDESKDWSESGSWHDQAVYSDSIGVSDAEVASQVTEGIMRGLRDLALDEAVSLHGALCFWTRRWENPLHSWFEAGPIGAYCMTMCIVYACNECVCV
jgi:hypothetical protein